MLDIKYWRSQYPRTDWKSFEAINQYDIVDDTLQRIILSRLAEFRSWCIFIWTLLKSRKCAASRWLKCTFQRFQLSWLWQVSHGHPTSSVQSHGAKMRKLYHVAEFDCVYEMFLTFEFEKSWSSKLWRPTVTHLNTWSLSMMRYICLNREKVKPKTYHGTFPTF